MKTKLETEIRSCIKDFLYDLESLGLSLEEIRDVIKAMFDSFEEVLE